MKMLVLMSNRETQLDKQFVKILAKVTIRLQALVSVEITRSTAACFWPIVAVCMCRFERPQRVGKRWPGTIYFPNVVFGRDGTYQRSRLIVQVEPNPCRLSSA